MAAAVLNDFDRLVDDMGAELTRGPQLFLPSRYWQDLNARNLAQLADGGFARFKRTVNQNYFAWIVSDPRDPQFLAALAFWLRRPRPSVAWARLVDAQGVEAGQGRVQPLGRGPARLTHAVYVALLWEFARRRDRHGLLKDLREPDLGDPILVRHGGRLISQDVANSAIEFYAIDEAQPHRPNMTVVELGGGYGRLGWFLLTAVPGLRYVAVDIPPALAVTQHYLTTLFPKLPTYPFRKGSPDPAAVARSRLAFLTPNQLDDLPSIGTDVFVNISSLQEMRPEQISRYLGLVDRHTSGTFYMKEWRSWTNPIDQVTITEADYPIPPRWKKVYSRRHPIQTHFFEAAYRVGV